MTCLCTASRGCGRTAYAVHCVCLLSVEGVLCKEVTVEGKDGTSGKTLFVGVLTADPSGDTIISVCEGADEGEQHQTASDWLFTSLRGVVSSSIT